MINGSQFCVQTMLYEWKSKWIVHVNVSFWIIVIHCKIKRRQKMQQTEKSNIRLFVCSLFIRRAREIDKTMKRNIRNRSLSMFNGTIINLMFVYLLLSKYSIYQIHSSRLWLMTHDFIFFFSCSTLLQLPSVAHSFQKILWLIWIISTLQYF